MVLYFCFQYAILQGIVFLGFIIAAVLALVFQSYVNGNVSVIIAKFDVIVQNTF